MNKLSLWNSRNIGNTLFDGFFDSFNFNPLISQKEAFSEWSEDGNELCISIEAPGFSKEDIKIESSLDGIKITGEIKNEELKRKISTSKFSYILERNDIDGDSIEAKLDSGILEIKLRKIREKESKIIEIR